MHSPDYPYFPSEHTNSTYRDSRDYNTRSKNATYIQKKYENLDSSYIPSDKYKSSKYDQNNYYSPRPKKDYIHPYDLRNSVNVLPNYQQELERAKYRNRNKRQHNDYNTARDKSPIPYNYKKEFDGTESRRYGRSPSPLSSSRYDLSMSSVSAHTNLDYNSKKNKYLEETVPEYLSKSNVGYVSRNYDDKNSVREQDKKALKQKYKSYFDTGKGNSSELVQKKYSQGEVMIKYDKPQTYTKQLDNKTYSSKSARQDYSSYNPKDYYSGEKAGNDNKYNTYDQVGYGDVDKRFAKKKYDDRNSRSSNQDEINQLLMKNKLSRINSKPKLETQRMEEKKKASTTSLMPKQILPSFAHKVDTKVSIKDFVLGKTKGEGKFGTVYMATHKMTDTLYAIKKIPKQIIKSHMLENQLALEIKLQTYINHPNVLKLYGFFDDWENIYLVLEYMEEGTLFQYLKKRVNKLTEKEVSSKIREVSSAIKYLHDLDIAHRDIKPENIVLSGGIAKLCDFGWATRCTDRRKTYCGTFDYAAPEILQGKEYDWCVDLWCLGVLTFELLTGKVPFYHISRKQTMKKILRVDRDQIVFPPEISWKAKDFVESLIKKDPHQRSRADELLSHPFLAEQKKQSVIL